MNVKKFGFWEWWCVAWAAYDVTNAVRHLIAGDITMVLFNAFFAVVMIAILFWNISLRKANERREAERQARLDAIYGVQDKV